MVFFCVAKIRSVEWYFRDSNYLPDRWKNGWMEGGRKGWMDGSGGVDRRMGIEREG